MKEKQNIQRKVFAYMSEHHMLQEGESIVAGISGGADSVCLLFLLLEWGKQHSLDIAVVHVNHMVRSEAGEDAAYVEELCKKHQLPFYLEEIDIRAKARQEQISEEEAGRNARYEAFYRVARQRGATKIAVAHNSNDRSETMLFNLFRGSGIKGLASIQPVRDQIIRPILCLERKEIEQYVAACGVSYCQDATNREDEYTRNRIRHHILPVAEELVAEGSVAHMAQTADMLSEIEDYLESQTTAASQECILAQEENKIVLSVEKLLQQHSAIQKRILLQVMKQLSPWEKDISYVHIKSLLEICNKEGNLSLNLPFGIFARREYERLYLELAKNEDMEDMIEDDFPTSEIMLSDLEKEAFSVFVGRGKTLKMVVFSQEKTEEVPKNQYTKWFDYDKISKSLCIRTRNIGDYLTIGSLEGQPHHKKLKDYFIAEKIPKNMRDRIPVLAEGQHILWLVGYRISEYYKVRENTKRILQVQLIDEGTE